MFSNEFKKIEKYMDLFLLNQKKTIRYLKNYNVNSNLTGGNIITDKVNEMQTTVNKIDVNSHEKLLEESIQILEKVTFLMEFIISQMDDDKLKKMNNDIDYLKKNMSKLKGQLGN